MSYPEEKHYHGKDAENGVALADVPEDEPLYGWRARVRKAEAALGIEAQGIKRVHEGATRTMLIRSRSEANCRARDQPSGIPRRRHGKRLRSGCRTSRSYTTFVLVDVDRCPSTAQIQCFPPSPSAFWCAYFLLFA